MNDPSQTADRRHYALLVLACVSFLNYLDRTLWSVLSVPVQMELRLSDTQLGLLGGLAFALFYATMGLSIARLSDRRSRINVVSVAIALWSSATAACGVAQSFIGMLLARIGVGVGEAGCVPASHSLLADYFPQSRRAWALGLFEAGGALGMMVGLLLSGWLADLIGWRATFIALGIPGILVALLLRFTLSEPLRGGLDGAPRSSVAPRATVGLLLGRRTYRLIVVGFALCIFGYYGSLQWLANFLSRSHHLSLSEIGVSLGFTFGAGAIIGTTAGALLAPMLIVRDRLWELRLPALCFAAAAPLFLLIYQAGSAPLALTACFMAAVVVSAGFAPALASIQSLAEAQIRATAVALVMFVSAIVGQGAGPAAVGALSDGLRAAFGQESLRMALSFSTLTLVASALMFWLASRSMHAERVN